MTALPVGTAAPAPLPRGPALAWFAAIHALAAGGTFRPAEPGPPFRLLPAVLLPPVAFPVADRGFPGLRARLAALDPALVTAAQARRVIGTAFLILPAVLGLPAGIGDVTVGIVAAAVATQVAWRSDGRRRRARWPVGIGLIDFALVLGIAALVAPAGPRVPADEASAEVMLHPPTALIPGFGVPASIILHPIAWLNLGGADD